MKCATPFAAMQIQWLGRRHGGDVSDACQNTFGNELLFGFDAKRVTFRPLAKTNCPAQNSPECGEALRTDAIDARGNNPMTEDVALFETLRGVTTATITTILLKKGLRNVWMRGPMPLRAGQSRIAGRAFTLRFVPAREDLATPDSWASPRSTRAAIEDMPEGAIAVADAMGVKDAGIFGDILCARMKRRNVAGLVTDGVVRDLAGVLATGLPVWTSGAAAPPSVAGLTFTGWQEPIGCGGVAIFPNDVIVADTDGAVVIPAALAHEVAAVAPEQERFEAWVVSEVERGTKLPGLYPPDAETRARYEATKTS